MLSRLLRAAPALSSPLRPHARWASTAAVNVADWEMFHESMAAHVSLSRRDEEAVEAAPLTSRAQFLQALIPGAVSSKLALSAAPAAVPVLHQFLQVFPPLCFGFLQLSGMKTVKEIKAKGDVGALSPLPFVSLATNCVVWVAYGALRGDLTILLPNATGLLCGLYYTNEYRKLAPAGVMAKYFATSAAIVGAVGGMLALLPAADAAHYIGLTGCTLAVILMASPLATLKTVIATKNTSAMPFVTSLATFMNASSWSAYGFLVAHDPMVWGPNALGLVAATVQMGLFAKFGIQTVPNPEPAAPAPVPEIVDKE